jgi:hypothetical protein
LESTGFGADTGLNIPFIVTSTFPSAGCAKNNCPNNGQTLETRFSEALAAGLSNFAQTPTINGTSYDPKTTYTEGWNLSLQHAFNSNTSATLTYVGSTTLHLAIDPEWNQPAQLLPVGANIQANSPFNQFGTSGRLVLYEGFSDYNGLQAKIERRFTNGLSFLGGYTWSHALDDAFTILGGSGDTFSSYRNPHQLGISYDYGSSNQDVRHRITSSIQYELPVGIGRKYLNSSHLLDAVIGGWSSTLIFQVQTSSPELVTSSFDTTNGVGHAYALRIGDPFKPGGTPNSAGSPCAVKTRTIQSWFNPCAFANPVQATGTNGLAPYGTPGKTMIYGPGFNRLDLALSKAFHLTEWATLQFRAEAYNLNNTEPLLALGSSWCQCGTDYQYTFRRCWTFCRDSGRQKPPVRTQVAFLVRDFKEKRLIHL